MKGTRRRDFFKACGAAAIGGLVTEGMATLHAQEKHEGANTAREFAPGEKIPVSGIYDVVHDRLDGDDHAEQHQVTLVVGGHFPPCKACGQWVRFRPYQTAQHAGAAPHLVP